MRGLPLDDYAAPTAGTAVALGFFDGVHRGHQAIMRGALDLAASLAVEPVAFTFVNHPTTVLAPERVPPLLTTPAERFRLVDDLGLRPVWRTFEPEFSHLEPERFIREVLVDRLRARAVSVGPNYHFGYQAQGRPALLQELGPRLGFEVRVAEPQELDGEIISSSRIRRAVADGDLRQASAAMGRPYRVQAQVETGDARGAGLGARTANLRVPAEKVQPAFGVYAVWAGTQGTLFPGVANFGVRPTFGGSDPRLEVHLFEFEGDLYGAPLEVFLVERLRPEQRFPDPDVLRAQIGRDVAAARALLEAVPPPASLG